MAWGGSSINPVAPAWISERRQFWNYFNNNHSRQGGEFLEGNVAKGPKLRQLYLKDKEARAFLKKHPEFAGFELETTQNAPSNEAYYSREADLDYGSKSLIVQEVLEEFPDPPTVKLLTAYYGGASMKELARISKVNPTATKHRIARAKDRVFKWAQERPLDEVEVKRLKVLASKTFVFKGRAAKAIKSPRYGWVLEDGRRLPEDVQDALDAMEWDFVDLEGDE